MGLGKTAQAIHACKLVKAKSVVVICPAILRINWRREFEMHWPDPTPGSSIPCLEIFSYDSLLRSETTSTLLSSAPFTLILDEAHYLKSPTSKRTKAILGRNGLIHKATHAWALTGTPMPNHPGELWTWLFTTGATRFSHSQWVDRYCTTAHTPFGVQIRGMTQEAGHVTELKAILQKNVLRRTYAETMADMPKLIHRTVNIELDKDIDPLDWMRMEKAYTRPFLEKKLKAEIDGTTQALNLYYSMRVTDHDAQNGYLQLAKDKVTLLRRWVGLKKAPVILKFILDEFATRVYNKLVLVCYHKDVIEWYRYHLEEAGIKVAALYGGTADKRRQKYIDAFQKPDSGLQCMILQPNAAGVGVTLTAAHHIIMAEPDWVPATNAQAIMRCYRIGQSQPVLVRYFVLDHSIDDRIMGTVRRKTEDQLKISLAERL